MRDIFTPLFLSVLTALFLAAGRAANPFVFTPLAVSAFAGFLALFYFNKTKAAYGVVVLALTLLFCGSFL